MTVSFRPGDIEPPLEAIITDARPATPKAEPKTAAKDEPKVSGDQKVAPAPGWPGPAIAALESSCCGCRAPRETASHGLMRKSAAHSQQNHLVKARQAGCSNSVIRVRQRGRRWSSGSSRQHLSSVAAGTHLAGEHLMLPASETFARIPCISSCSYAGC